MSETHAIPGTGIICACHACTQARWSQIEKALDQPVEMTSLRDIRQKLETLAGNREDDERWRKLVLERLEGIGNCLAGLLNLGAKAPRKAARKRKRTGKGGRNER